MKKRLFAAVVLGVVLGTAAVFADHPKGFGIGGQFGWSGGIGGGLSLKIPSVPVYWLVDVNTYWLGVAGDFYLIDKDFTKGFGWYLGVGGYVNIGFWGDNLDLAVGARLPIGLSWRPIELLELYLQVVPSIGLQVLPQIGLWPNFFGGNLGIRLWF